MPHSELSPVDIAELIRLEEAMWRPETRFDPVFQERYFAEDFIELGRSGRVYTRAQIMAAPAQAINCRLPLQNIRMRSLCDDAVQVLYDSIRDYEGAVPEYTHRSSLWTRTTSGWVMRFHQATPFVPHQNSCHS